MHVNSGQLQRRPSSLAFSVSVRLRLTILLQFEAKGILTSGTRGYGWPWVALIQRALGSLPEMFQCVFTDNKLLCIISGRFYPLLPIAVDLVVILAIAVRITRL